MEVILTKEVKRLGKPGEVRNVSDGYARNYLIPRGLAVAATEEALQRLNQKASAVAHREASVKTTAETKAVALQNVQLVFKAKAGESGRLYGSITSGDIAEQLAKKIGSEVDKRKVILEEPIKEVGKFKVEVKLHADVKITISVTVEGEAAS